MWASLRHPSLRHATIMVVVLGCAGLAAAAQLRLGHQIVAAADSAEISVMDETTGSLGTRGAGPALSDEDRFHIYEGVMRIPDAPTADEPVAEVAEALSDQVP